MDDVHLLTARHFRYELRRGGKIFSSKFGAREACIAPQAKLARGFVKFFPNKLNTKVKFSLDGVGGTGR